MSQIAFDHRDEFSVEKGVGKHPMPRMHYHNTYELYYLINGEREYFLENKFYKVTRGDLFLIPSNVLHRTAGKGASRILVYFSKEALEEFFSDRMIKTLLSDTHTVFRGEESVRKEIEKELERILLETKNNPNGENTKTYCAVSLCKILSLVKQSKNLYTPNTYADGRIGDIVRYINGHYAEIDGIGQIAEKFYVSKYHLCRIFNKSIGVPLISYLNTIKIRGAIELMKNEELNLTQIATRCGFNSSSYFCKVFKDEKGQTPAAFRRKMKL